MHERIYKEINALQSEFRKLAINGKRTSASDLKKVEKCISDSAYVVAQECQVIMGFPKRHIEGKKVVLGEPSIILPDCRIISIEQLKDIEYGRT